MQVDGKNNWRLKKRGETDLEWKTRVAAQEQAVRNYEGPIITDEAAANGEYEDTFVIHHETMTLTKTKRNCVVSPIEALARRGALLPEQVEAAEQIEMAHGIITSGVGVRGASLDARVDNSGAGRNMLIEKLAMVRLQVVYSKWRSQVKRKPAIVLDMLTGRRSLFETARAHKTGWPRARRLLIDSLDAWIEICERVCEDLSQEDLDRAHAELEAVQKPKGA